MVFTHYSLTYKASEFNAETQRRKGAEAQRRRGAKRSVEARTSGENPAAHGAREPVGRGAAPNASVRSSASPHRPALSESAGLASHSFLKWDGTQTIAFENINPRRNLRAASAQAGGKPDRDEHWYSKRSGFSPAAGDREIAGVSAGTPGNFINAGNAPLRLRASAPLRRLPTPDLRHLRDLRASTSVHAGRTPPPLCVG